MSGEGYIKREKTSQFNQLSLAGQRKIFRAIKGGDMGSYRFRLHIRQIDLVVRNWGKELRRVWVQLKGRRDKKLRTSVRERCERIRKGLRRKGKILNEKKCSIV